MVVVSRLVAILVVVAILEVMVEVATAAKLMFSEAAERGRGGCLWVKTGGEGQQPDGRAGRSRRGAPHACPGLMLLACEEFGE